jgi:hypothetical protein
MCQDERVARENGFDASFERHFPREGQLEETVRNIEGGRKRVRCSKRRNTMDPVLWRAEQQKCGRVVNKVEA